MNLRIAHGALLLAVLGTAAYGADVYRSTAPDGTVSFSDRPQGSDAQFVFTAAARPAVPGAPAPAADARARAAAVATPPDAPATPEALPAGPNAGELREQRQKNCEIARER